MSKDNYSGMVALLEYMDRKTAKPKTPKLFKGKTNKNVDYADLPDLIRKREDELKGLKKFMKEFTEEKKPEKKGVKFSSLEWFIIGIICYPLVGPLYQTAIHNLNTVMK